MAKIAHWEISQQGLHADMLCALSVLNGVQVYGHNRNPNPNPDGNLEGQFYFIGDLIQ